MGSLSGVRGRIGSIDRERGDQLDGRKTIVVGTSGYSFDDWIGNFYPAGTKKGDMLREYCKHFPCVEVNATYYRIPGVATFRGMEAKTPLGFEFIIKANQEMTHKKSRDQGLYRTFTEAIQPIRDAGKFSGVIAQFPWGFKYTPENREHLKFLADRFRDCPLFVEFRNGEWIRESVFEGLEAEGIAYCSVDEPRLKGLVPPLARATAGIGYVRLHGRNAKTWWARGRAAGDRYDYLYSEDELKEWVAKIQAMSKTASRTFVFFNNCHAGQAARNAKLMQALLDLAL